MYDGTVLDEQHSAVIGGESEEMKTRVTGAKPADDLKSSVKTAVAALSGQSRALAASDLEVAVLERGSQRRCFRRLTDVEVAQLLSA
jgi:proteasome alpha subunit